MAMRRNVSPQSFAESPHKRHPRWLLLPVEAARVKIWIDCSNSPHPLLFAPVGRRLVEGGHEVVITARDNAQTLELARERWPDVEVIGGASPRGRSSKVAAICGRIADLRRWAARVRPDVALSHNSYAQIVAARSLRIPAVTAMDFEHQPANHLAFRLATTILVPEAMDIEAIRRQGAAPGKIVQYPGLKEELYIGDFKPDRDILTKVSAGPRPRIVAVARTAPTRALYHSSSNPLFETALRTVCSQDGIVCVVLTRHAEQIAAIEDLGLPNCILPRTAIDSRSLIYAADVMIGAGGTMTREAAVMGIPTWTLFAGKTPAVDAWLERREMIRRLTRPDQMTHLTTRLSSPRTPEELHARGRLLEGLIVRETLAAGGVEAISPGVAVLSA
jgi:predicted glycosyltransferase